MNTSIFNYLQNILPIELASRIRLFASNRLSDTLKNDIINFRFEEPCSNCGYIQLSFIPSWGEYQIRELQTRIENNLPPIAIMLKDSVNYFDNFTHKQDNKKEKEKKKINKQLYSSSKQLHISFATKRNISKNHTRKEAKCCR